MKTPYSEVIRTKIEYLLTLIKHGEGKGSDCEEIYHQVTTLKFVVLFLEGRIPANEFMGDDLDALESYE